jgi:hypothetical protein
VRLPGLDDRSRRDFLHKTVTATGSLYLRLTWKLVALLLLAVVSCSGSVQDERNAAQGAKSAIYF